MKNTIKQLIELGFKKYQLEVVKDMGVFFIILPHNAYTIDMMKTIGDVVGGNCIIGSYPHISKNSLSIRTNTTY